MDGISYVLMVVVDPASQCVIGLTKKKGLPFLLNKFTFPGGKIESGESIELAASRELLEETGVEVSSSSWVPTGYVSDSGYEIHVLAALSLDVPKARTMESEPVTVLDVQGSLDEATKHPERYAPEYVDFLGAALKALKLR